MQNRNQLPSDSLIFELIGDDNKIATFVNNFRSYVGQINLFIPEIKLGLPSKIIFKTSYGDHHIFSRNSYDTKNQFKIYDNQCDVNAVITFNADDEYIRFVKSSIGYKRYHPFFISYDMEDSTADLDCEDGIIGSGVDFNPYVFIKEIIEDVLPVNMGLVASVSDRAEMIFLQSKSSDASRENFFPMMPRDVVNKIAENLIEIEFKNDACSFKFFKSAKNIRPRQQQEARKNTITCNK